VIDGLDQDGLIEAVWSRCADVPFVDDGSRAVVLPLSQPNGARPLLLHGLSADIWRQLHGEASVSEISGRLGLTDDRPRVESCLAALSAHGLVVRT
jgi:hypothetical protein